MSSPSTPSSERTEASHEAIAQLVRLMEHAEASRSSYDRGVSEERLRIARDIHDNIGVQLMGAQPFEAFKEVIDREIAHARRLVQGGTPARNVYAEIIRNGRTVESGRLEDLRHVGHTSVAARTRRPVALEDVGGVIDLAVDGDRVSFEVDNDHLDEAIERLAEADIVSLTCAPPTLEELFLRHYDGSDADDGTPATAEAP